MPGAESPVSARFAVVQSVVYRCSAFDAPPTERNSPASAGATPQIIIKFGKETQMDTLHHHEREAILNADAKAASLMFIVGIVALLASPATEVPGEGTMASASTVSLEPTREIPVAGVDVPDGYKLSVPEAAESAAGVPDDPPTATF
jgi:hypothetical protein